MAADELGKMLSEMVQGMRVLTSTVEKLVAEQDRSAKALGEIGLLLQNHGSAIIQLA